MCKSFCCWATLTWINGNCKLLSLSLLLRPVLLTCVSCKLCQAHTLNLDARYERGLPDLWQHEVWFSQMLSFHINVMMLVSSFFSVLIIHDPYLSENMSVFSLASLLVPHLGLWSDSASHLDSVPVQQSTESCLTNHKFCNNFTETLCPCPRTNSGKDCLRVKGHITARPTVEFNKKELPQLKVPLISFLF